MGARRNLITLGILFAICLSLEVPFTIESINENLHVATRARVPFLVKSPYGTLDQLRDEAKAAHLTTHDHPVTIDGRSARGLAGVIATARAHRAGDTVEVTVERDGAPFSTRVTLAPKNENSLAASEWILIGFLHYLTPWFCILLGFTVAFLRPNDGLAWLLLLLMLSFGQVAQGDGFVSIVAGWSEPWRTPAIFGETMLSATWGVWMMLFGQYFPTREANGRWNRAARWGLGLPLVILALTAAVVDARAIDDARAFAPLQRLLLRFSSPLILLMMAAISTFFINIFRKWSTAQSADEKRRLKLLYFGTTASLTPLFLLFIASLILRRTNINTNNWILFPSLLALFLFPLTMAYVIVVEKAMDLKVAIRQGLQYALARRGVPILTALLIMLAILLAGRLLNDPSVGRPQQLTIVGLLVLLVVRLRKLADVARTWIDKRFFREAVNTERVLHELGEKVRTIVEVQPLLETVTSTISAALHVPRIAVMMRQNGDYAPAHALGYGLRPDMRFAATSGVAVRLEQSREPLRVSHKRPESWVDKNVEALGTELLLPMAVKDRLLGFLSLGPKLSEEPYTPTDVSLLESVASQTGMALENSRLTEAVASEVAQRERLNRELEIAREVQERLFPQSGPEIGGLDYAGKCRPASSVGGDYYDFVSMSDGRLGIAVGDISGKGVPAALLMASLQASLRGLAIANPPALSALMGNLNRLIYDTSPSNRYATFFYGVYDPISHEFRYVNGGHNPPMVFRGNEILRLEEGGPVVGLFGPAQYDQASVQLQSGDTLVLFTDGVSEAMNHAEEEFDEERLMAAVRSGAKLKSSELIDHVMEACDAFANGAPQHDDMTLVVVRVE